MTKTDPIHPGGRGARAASLPSIAALILLLLANVAPAAETLSPFTAVEFEGDTPFVQYDGKWYELLELEGMKAGEIVGFCRKTWPGKWEKRFAEDLVEVLEKMGKRPGRSVRLSLKSKETGKVRRVSKARMTKENRRAVWDAANRKQASSGPRTRLTAVEAAADLRFLRGFLEEHHSYRLRIAGYLGRFEWAGGDVETGKFALHVARLLAPLGDGHTRVRGRWNWLPKGYAPFRVGVAGERLVALDPAGRRLLDSRRPYLRALDGRPVKEWLQAAQAIIAQSSPQYRLWNGAEYLSFVGFLRGELGLDNAPRLSVELESEDGSKARRVELPLADRPLPPATLPGGPTRTLQGNIGYLRIPEMDSEPRFLSATERAMDGFAKTRGLILDLRGNGGGSRKLLRLLLPRVLDKPRVVNAARYRLPTAERPESTEGHLENRFLYPATWSGWTKADKTLIEQFTKTFQPEWMPPEEHFTRWHFMIVRPSATRYTRPVVVLMDAQCFSATDIFLAAFKGVPGVTLLGVPSGGGSGRSRKVTLPKSGVRLRVSSMASFQPDGKLYDGNGVQPDMVVEPTPEDWIGLSDSMLDAAVARIREARD
jgi:C-terminal processing protease CtpA/Prc